jgi:sugar lactone lactonase YvrE
VRFPEGGFAGDGQDARTAKLHNPTDIAVGPYGDIFIADTFNQRIRRVDAVTNIITTVAGTGVDTFSGDGGPAQQAALNFPSGIAIDAAGGLLIADTFNHRIRRVDPSNAVIDTIAGGPRGGAGGDGGPARQALLSWPGGVAVSAAGTIYIDDGSGLRSIDPQSGVINLLDANLRAPALAGNILYAIDVQRQVVVRLDEHAGRSETLTQSPNNPSAAALGDGQSSTQAHISAPDDVVVDKKGNFFWIEGTRIRGVDASTGRVRTVVGYNPETATGSDAETTGLGASTISGLTIGPDGSLYATILSEGAIYRVDPMSGRTTVVAFVPSASHISFQGNSSLLVSGDDLYRVNTQTGAVRTLIDVQDNWSITDVGSLPGGEIVYSECDLVDAAYLANVCRIQELLVGGGAPRTLAGGGSRDLAGSTGSASGSLLLDVSAMTVDESGAVFYAEREGAWIRRLNPGTGVVSTVAGSGQQGYGDDLEGAPPASFNAPQGLAAVGTGQLYVADTDNDRIRVITPMR